MPAGVTSNVNRGILGGAPSRVSPTPISASTTPQQAYPAAIQKSGADYDTLMQAYQNALNPQTSPTSAGLMQGYGRIASGDTGIGYRPTSDVSSAMSQLKGLGETGGLSPQDITDMRARGISPIRAVYANAMREVGRQKSLQGGYSPNYTAAMAKMARDLSENVAGQTSNVNAGIAEMVQRGKLSAAPAYGQLAESEAAGKRGVESQNMANRLAAMSGMQNLYGMDTSKQLQALQGMTSLYGTTPALANMFGQQVVQQGQLGLQNKAINQQGGLGLINAAMRGIGNA